MIRHFLRANSYANSFSTDQRELSAQAVVGLRACVCPATLLGLLVIRAVLLLLRSPRQRCTFAVGTVDLAVVAAAADADLAPAVGAVETPVTVTEVIVGLDAAAAVGDYLGGTSRHQRDVPRRLPGALPRGLHRSHQHEPIS